MNCFWTLFPIAHLIIIIYIYMYMCMYLYIYRGVDQNWRTNKLDQNYSKLVMCFLFGGLAWVEQTGITMTR